MLNTIKHLLRKDIKKLDLCVTHKCNLTCGTCNIWQIYRDDKELLHKETSLDGYRSFFERHNSWNRISFTGGEPFLRRDLNEIIFAALDRCGGLDVISINTNGFLVEEVANTAASILEIKSLKGLFFSISLDGIEEVHDKNRGMAGAFRRATETFNRLKEIGDKRLSIHYEYTISKNNIGNLKRLFDGGFNPNDFIITFARVSRRYDNIGMECAVDEGVLREEVRYFLSRLRVVDLESLGQWTFLKHFMKGIKIPCVAGKNTFHMDPYGNIYLCTLLNSKVGSISGGITGEAPVPEGCYCYTPCESYFGLAMEGPKALLKALLMKGNI